MGIRRRLSLLAEAVDYAEPQRLLGQEGPSGKQQVECRRGARQAWQHPGETVLGDQAASGEGRRQLRAARREADVAHHRDYEAEAGAGAVDRGDHRLAKRSRQALRAWVGLRLGAALLDFPEIVEVGAGAEAAAGPGEDDRSHAWVRIGFLEAIEVGAAELGRPGVESLGSVQRDSRHAVLDQVENGLRGRHQGPPTPANDASTRSSRRSALPWR